MATETSLKDQAEKVKKHIEDEDHRSILKLCNTVLKEFSLNLTWICIKCVSLIQTSEYAVLLRFIESFPNNSDIFRSLTFYRAYGLYSCKRNEEALQAINEFEKNPFPKQKRPNNAFEFGLSKDEIVGLKFLKAQVCYRLNQYSDGLKMLAQQDWQECSEYATENEMVTNEIAMLVSNHNSEEAIKKFFQEKIDSSHTCDFVYNSALALITSKRFDKAKDFIIASINVCEESMRSESDEYTEDDIKNDIGQLELLLGFCYVLLGNEEEAWKIYEKLYTNNCLSDASRKLILMNNRLSINDKSMDIKEQLDLYKKLMKANNFNELDKVGINNGSQTDLNTIRNDNDNNNKLNGVFESESIKVCMNRHLVLMCASNASNLIKNTVKTKESPSDNKKKNNKGKNKNKGRNKNKEREIEMENEKNKLTSLAASLLGKMKFQNAASEPCIWLKLAPKYNEKQYQYCRDILKSFVVNNLKCVSLYTRVMLVQMMILDQKYLLALNEMKSIESIRYLPATMSILLTLCKKVYLNKERKRDQQLSKLMEECLNYYEKNGSAINKIMDPSDANDFILKLSLDYCRVLVSLGQFGKAYDVCKKLMGTKVENDELRALNGLCAAQLNDLDDSTIERINVSIETSNSVSSLLSSIPKPNFKNSSKGIDIDIKLDNGNKASDNKSERKSSKKANTSAKKAPTEKKRKGKNNYGSGASQGYVGNVDDYRVTEGDSKSNKKVVLPEHVKARKRKA